MKIVTSTRARRVRVTIRPGGEVVATLPRGVSRVVLDRFLARKASWIADAVMRMKKVPQPVKLPRGHYKANRAAALRFVRERIEVLNKQYGFRFGSITIRNQRSRWGSCSKRGALSFNYRILLLPPELADYIIVHELCHLQELNHSKRFWELVARAIPNPRAARAELRKNGARFA